MLCNVFLNLYDEMNLKKNKKNYCCCACNCLLSISCLKSDIEKC